MIPFLLFTWIVVVIFTACVQNTKPRNPSCKGLSDEELDRQVEEYMKWQEESYNKWKAWKDEVDKKVAQEMAKK